MEKLKHKLKGHGGFTLVEMLIVVAIIAILVAVSIPLVSSALERTKHATDAANERAAKAEILVQYLADDGITKITEGTVYYYDAAKGMLVETGTNIKGYGKHDRTGIEHNTKIIAIRIHKNAGTSDTVKTGEVEIMWTAEKADVTTFTVSTTLCSAYGKADHSDT